MRFESQAAAAALLLSVTVLGSHGFDENGTDAEPRVCTQPVQEICKDYPAQEERRHAMQTQWKELALKKTEEQFAKGTDFSKYLKIISTNAKSITFENAEEVKIFRRILARYHLNLREAMGLTDKKLTKYLEESKVAMVAAIRANGALSAETKKEMEAKVSKTQLVSFETAVTGVVEVQGKTLERLMTNYTSICGWDGFGGLALNHYLWATATGTDPQSGKKVEKMVINENILFVCPTLFGSAIVEESESLAPTATMAHEVGHSIDDKDFAKSYEAIQACWNEHAAKSLYWPKGADGKPASPKGKEREMIADFWAAEGLANWLKTRAVTQEDRVRLVKHAVHLKCGTVESPAHPAGEFRVEAILNHPAIRSVVGCQAPLISNPACTLSGAVPSSK